MAHRARLSNLLSIPSAYQVLCACPFFFGASFSLERDNPYLCANQPRSRKEGQIHGNRNKRMTYHDEDRGVTLEDLHGQMFEWETCRENECEFWGHHTVGCFLRGKRDEDIEFKNDLAIMAANGK